MAKTYKYKGREASLMLESRADCQFVVEAEDSHVPSGALGRLFGVYAYMDQKNENGRTYDFENYFAQVQALQPAIKAKRLLGELEHVKRRAVRYGNVSHRLDSIEWNPEKRRFEGLQFLIHPQVALHGQLLQQVRHCSFQVAPLA